jgi:hypothetical protein
VRSDNGAPWVVTVKVGKYALSSVRNRQNPADLQHPFHCLHERFLLANPVLA